MARARPCFRLLEGIAKAIDGLRPDFLWGLVELRNFMRLSLMKAAHAVLSDAA